MTAGALDHLESATDDRAPVPRPAGHSPEKPRVTLGFIPLTDCAPLVIALERGHFARQGLDVTLSREPSWSAIRDKVAFGVIDGAHLLAGIPLASTLGVSGVKTPMITALSLSLNGNAITVSTELHARMVEADPIAMAHPSTTSRALKKVIDRQRPSDPPLTFAMVFPFSSHHYQLRMWMNAAGIAPDRDVRLLVVPPPRMVESLRHGVIDGYAVGDPWNQLAVQENVGRVVITGLEIWNNAPEKVFGVTRAWAEQHPRTHRALLRALIEAAIWLDQPENRSDTAAILCREEYLNVPVEAVRKPLMGRYQYFAGGPLVSLPDFNVFSRYDASFPWRSHAEWIISQMKQSGQAPATTDAPRSAAEVYRPDIYRTVAAELGLACPAGDHKPVELQLQGAPTEPTTARIESAPSASGRSLTAF